MKKEPRLDRLLRGQAVFVCLLILLFFSSTVVGQNGVAGKQLPDATYKKSDSPILRLPGQKKNWKPIPVPKYRKKATAPVSRNPKSVVEYDLLTRRVAHSDYIEIFDTVSPQGAASHVEQSLGMFQDNDRVETVFPPDSRIKISPTVDFPWRTIAKLYITFPDGSHFVASGAIIGRSDGIGFHCLTAAHSVYRKEYGGWATTVEVIPALDNDYTPFYSAWAIKIKINEGWFNDSLPEYDWAAITLDRQIGNFTGWMDRFTTSDLSWYQRLFYCAGYPLDRDFGLSLYYDSDSGRVADEFFHWYYMDASEGQNGMPIWAIDGNTRRIVSIHIGDDQGTGSNRGVRLNIEKFIQLNQWLNDDAPPTDRPDLIDDGPKWSDFKQLQVVRGFSRFRVWNDVRNIGTAYSGELKVAYYASLDSKIEADQDFLIGEIDIKSIPPFTWRDAEWSGIFPEQIPSGEYFIGWIIDPDNRVVEFDESNNVAMVTEKKLTVRDPYVEILSPNGGEVFAIGEENTIQWFTAGGSGLITIDVSCDGGESWQNLATNIPDSGAYAWKIPLSQQPVFACLIKVTDTFKNLSDSSDANFIIETRPTTPGVPQDGAEFTNQKDVTFTWSAADDPETGISAYQVQVGTTPQANDIADTLTDQLSWQVVGTHNQKIYARVRAKNGVGLFSPWTPSSDGILIDLTPPVVTTPPVDAGHYTAMDTILFQWNPASDEESGVLEYQIQVSTDKDTVDLFDGWIGNNLNYSIIGKHAQTLYARIRAKNGALSLSDWSDWSDGITIDKTPPTTPGIPYSEALTVNFFDVPFYWEPATEDVSEIEAYHIVVIDVNADSTVLVDEWIGDVREFMVSAKDGQSLLALVQAKNKTGLIGDWATAAAPVTVELTPALLTLIDASSAFKGEGWEHAIDNDIIGWDGTVTAYTTVQPYPYAIFGFVGGGMGRVEKIKLLTDTRVGFKNRWVTHFRVLYSTTGIQDQDFLPLVQGEKMTGGWEEFCFPEQTVKFIKFIVDAPTSATTRWCQVGEFQVFGRAEYVKTEKAELEITHGTPTEPKEDWDNVIDGDIQGWDGTTTAMTLRNSPANVIFNFADNSIKNISKIRILTDTGVRFAYRWLRAFTIQVSTTGINKQDFSTVFSATKTGGEWQSYYFDPVPAKYVKLILEHPTSGETDYCQIGEVEIYTQADTGMVFNELALTPQSEAVPAEIIELPDSYVLRQNYPNPFNPETTIPFQLPQQSRVTLTIYNMMGQQITTLVNGLLPAGYHSVQWRGLDSAGRKVPSGVYLCQFRAGKVNVTRKMILLE